MLDVTSLVLAGIDGIPKEQAKLTFAMARHAVVDLTQVVSANRPALRAGDHNRLRSVSSKVASGHAVGAAAVSQRNR